MYTIDKEITDTTGNTIEILVNGIALNSVVNEKVCVLKTLGKDKVLKSHADNLLTTLKLTRKVIGKIASEKESLQSDLNDSNNKNFEMSKEISKQGITINTLNKEIDRLKSELEKPCTVTEEVTDNTDYKRLLQEEKDKHQVTLELLKQTQKEIDELKSKQTIIMEECDCKETPCEVKEEVVVEEVIKEEIETPVLIDESTAKVVVESADKLQNFIDTLSEKDKTSLKTDILKGHAKDKRLSTTLNNWIKKYPLLDTQVYFMFKTALSRRRGKGLLKKWYDKYDTFQELNTK